MSRPSETPISSSRRLFLKSSGLTIAATVSGAVQATAKLVPPHTFAVDKATHGDLPSDPVSLVYLLQGTDSTRSFSRGNTLPIASRPFGMAHWTLQSGADTPWMFQPGERRIQGFRCTHQLSPWLSDYGHAAFLPFCGEINPDSSKRASSYRPEDATFAPHSLRLAPGALWCRRRIDPD
jgi:putative alpha-1,2-mannosidase